VSSEGGLAIKKRGIPRRKGKVRIGGEGTLFKREEEEFHEAGKAIPRLREERGISFFYGREGRFSPLR